jgi:hypothetical protein
VKLIRLNLTFPETRERKERGRIETEFKFPLDAGSNEELESVNVPSVRKNEKYEDAENVVGNNNFIFPNSQRFSHEAIPTYSDCSALFGISISAELSLVLNSTSVIFYQFSIFIFVCTYSLRSNEATRCGNQIWSEVQG